MDTKDIIKISVRNLVEFVMQSGDIGAGFCSPSRMTDAIRAHQAIQKQSGENYTAEVTVSYIATQDDMELEISGRIDGVIKNGDSIVIDEIKTTTASLDSIDEDYNPLHFAQAKCYACIYGIQNGLLCIGVQVTYYQMESGQTRVIYKHFNMDELKKFLDDIVSRYLEWEGMVRKWRNERDCSIKNMDFPFSSYRKGQREFAVAVYRTIKDGGRLFAQAPTGIGKTISVLFPAIKAMGEGLTSKIFYLTARTTVRAAAEDAIDIMRRSGLRIKSLTLTAKEKICFCPGAQCHPDHCVYASGYYDRVMEAVNDIYAQDSYTRRNIEEYAKKHGICPFEFSLDLALWCDCIICDYNYAFDPRVYLKRFFMEDGGDYCFLIDEAHNLVDRSREMFSAKLYKKPILDMKKAARAYDKELYKSLKEINDYMIKLRKECEEGGKGFAVKDSLEEGIYPLLRKFVKTADAFLAGAVQPDFRSALVDVYFEVMAFLRISEYFDERYVTCIEKTGSDTGIKVFCVDPSYVMADVLKRGKCAVFFSATLSPMDYFIRTLGGGPNCSRLKLPSPYPSENLCVMMDCSISTKFRDRELSYDRVAEAIYTAVAEKPGNYMVYFPSYKYMDEVYVRFYQSHAEIRCVCQKPGMSEEDRDDFINLFMPSNDGILVGFAVMGGVFGEGIDLAGDRLCGAVIVGVGLPQLCMERDIICRYFNDSCEKGFEFAYMYPGINKVTQAAGRVIRSENDRGVVLLIDERFAYPSYRDLLPGEWNLHAVRGTDAIKGRIRCFWDR